MSLIINSYQFTAAGGSDYPTGAAMAISLREIPGYAWTGAVIRVRRYFDGTEADFYQGATKDSLNTTRGGGGTDIETWLMGDYGTIPKAYDQSGNGNDLYYGTVNRQPRISDDGTLIKVNGMPAMSWSGSPNIYTFTVTNPLSAAENWTSILVGKRPNGSFSLWGLTGGYFAVYSIAVYKDGNTYAHSTSGYIQAASAPTTQSIWLSTMAGATREIRRNGSDLGASYTAASNSNNLTEFGENESGAEGSFGFTQEFLFWSADKHGSNSAIEAAANGGYSVY